MYQAKTSRNKVLLMRRLVNLKLQRETTVAEHTSEFQSLVNQLTSVDLQFDDEMQALLLLSSLPESWETLVVSLSNSAPNEKLTTSMVMDALFNEEARRREMGLTDQIREGHIKRDCPKYKAQVQSSDTAATAVMAVDEDESDVLLAASDNVKSDWVLDSSSAYHLCKDREVFSTYAICKGRIWMANNTSSRVVGRGSIRFSMADGEGCSFDASGGTLRVSKENKEMLGISKENGQGKQSLHRSTQSKHRGTWRIRSGTRAQGDALEYVLKSGQTRVVQPVQNVYREAQRKETKSILRSCTAKGAAMPKKERWSHDNSQSDVLCGAPRWGCGAPRWGVQGTSSYGGPRSETVKKDNLKTSDYPPVGWRVRLLSPAHLDESTFSSQAQARLEFIWSVHVTVKLSSYLELLESVYLFVFLVRLG
ncbi:hypothetical protein Acr_17g0009250 [Actinidia rufa]|uniref:Retrovirus-related Pol polyprotein from transposon TNT 1-94-like beta-barrel domain-containing protein n=1 Tax=Actinidia rufa TaxID=165716 RepID=A0A7J0G3J6_9ERIC|nr:hypothetical protein Acr_17g0009250 [Actinidia rufa]